MVKPVTHRSLFWGTSWSFWSAIFLGLQYYTIWQTPITCRGRVTPSDLTLLNDPFKCSKPASKFPVHNTILSTRPPQLGGEDYSCKVFVLMITITLVWIIWMFERLEMFLCNLWFRSLFIVNSYSSLVDCASLTIPFLFSALVLFISTSSMEVRLPLSVRYISSIYFMLSLSLFYTCRFRS